MTKEQISTAVQSAIDGNASPLEVFAMIKTYEKNETDFIENAKQQVEHEALKEAAKYSENSFTHKGYKIEKRQGRAIYDFKNVSSWNTTKEKLAQIERLSKLAASTQGKTIVDDETGEIVEPCIITKTKDILIIKS